MAIPRVIILSEIMRGKTFELTKDLYTIGRTDDKDVVIPDGTISTLHCELIKDGDSYIALDKNSTNGTRINGIKITEQKLCNSDILQVGGIEILFDSEDKANTTSITTQTAIDLEHSAGSFAKGKMSNIDRTKSGQVPGEETKKSKKAFIIVISFLVLVVIALLILLMQKLLS
ncbi:MAG: FHA domain-containing protein [Lentisphaeraceae bacterium]|nr:FHA domain-containing protein [Lentisphaeraceae bacterium]